MVGSKEFRLFWQRLWRFLRPEKGATATGFAAAERRALLGGREREAARLLPALLLLLLLLPLPVRPGGAFPLRPSPHHGCNGTKPRRALEAVPAVSLLARRRPASFCPDTAHLPNPCLFVLSRPELD